MLYIFWININESRIAKENLSFDFNFKLPLEFPWRNDLQAVVCLQNYNTETELEVLNLKRRERNRLLSHCKFTWLFKLKFRTKQRHKYDIGRSTKEQRSRFRRNGEIHHLLGHQGMGSNSFKVRSGRGEASEQLFTVTFNSCSTPCFTTAECVQMSYSDSNTSIWNCPLIERC